MTDTQEDLRQLGDRIEARVQAIRAEHDWWPCRRGCDHCCRNLARPLELTIAEWSRVDEAVAALPATISSEIQINIRALLNQIEGALTTSMICPYLNQQDGCCYIYAARPIACRTYGFFVARDHDQYCTLIETEVASRGDRSITWGNAEVVRHDLNQIGGTLIPFDVYYNHVKR
jgi:uncharacterized protein